MGDDLGSGSPRSAGGTQRGETNEAERSLKRAKYRCPSVRSLPAGVDATAAGKAYDLRESGPFGPS